MATINILSRVRDASGAEVKRLTPLVANPISRIPFEFTLERKKRKGVVVIFAADMKRAQPFRVQFVEELESGETLMFEPQVWYQTEESARRCSERRLKRFVKTGSWFMERPEQIKRGLVDQAELYASFVPVQDTDSE